MSPLRTWLRQERAREWRWDAMMAWASLQGLERPHHKAAAGQRLREPTADLHKPGRDCSGSITACGVCGGMYLRASELLARRIADVASGVYE